MKKDVVLAVIGSGGDGVISAGEILARAAAHEGLYVFLTKSYGPQIRGGESSCRIRVSHEEVLTAGDELDAIFVFSWKDFSLFKEEYPLAKDCLIVVDEKDETPLEAIPIDPHHIPSIHKIPFEKIAKEQTGSELSKNMVLIGAIIELIGWPEKAVQEAIRSKFARKGESAISANLRAVECGKKFVRENFADGVELKLIYERRAPKLLMTGNEALAYGALIAGCRMYAGYPITPASEIIEWMSLYMPKFGGTVVQAEDEISAAGIALGASYAGVKAMCGTSGPGMSLKQEFIGLASMAEIPLVVVDVQRTGPSTGIPSRTEQADLNIAICGSHGDAPRAVLAPVDVEDCFYTAIDAFNIAEKFQLPVIILSDQFLAQRKESFNLIKTTGFPIFRRLTPSEEDLKDYRRFRLLPNGVSPMAIPGIAGGEYTAVGIEHDPYGHPSSSTATHIQMSVKRASKLEAIAEEFPLIRVYGEKPARVAIIGWGSTKGVIKDIVNRLRAERVRAIGAVPRLLHPLPVKALTEALEGVEHFIVIEQSHSGQFYRHLRAYLELPGKIDHYSRAGGNPLSVNEVLDFISSQLKRAQIRAAAVGSSVGDPG